MSKNGVFFARQKCKNNCIFVKREKQKNESPKITPLIQRQDLSIKKPLEGPQGALKELAC